MLDYFWSKEGIKTEIINGSGYSSKCANTGILELMANIHSTGRFLHKTLVVKHFQYNPYYKLSKELRREYFVTIADILYKNYIKVDFRLKHKMQNYKPFCKKVGENLGNLGLDKVLIFDTKNMNHERNN